MTWFKVDDSFYRSRKVRKLGNDRVSAVGLWTLCGDWAADNLSDGFVPWEVVEEWDPRRRLAVKLIVVTLWFEVEHDGEPGIQFHDWHDWQPTKEQVIQRRKADAERRARWREARRHGVTPSGPEASSPDPSQQESRQESRDVSRRDTRVSSRGASRPGSALPDPTRPDPTRKEEEHSLAALGENAPEFDQFWAAYPRRVERRAAEKAWRAAINRNVTPARMIAGARRYADATRDAEARFIKHPAAWINAGAYDDLDATPEPPTPAASFTDLRRRGAAQEVANLINAVWVEPSQPPDDPTPPWQWLQDRAVEFIDAHADELRAALAERRTG